MNLQDYPKISIITPSFNQGEFIEKTILSVLNQGYPNLEYIIIDGGSTDNTIDIIRKYEKKITYWVSEPDQGQSNAINKGLKKATGEIINWLNSDDYLEQGALAKIAEEFRDKNIDILCGYSNYDYKGKSYKNRTTTIIESERDFARNLSLFHFVQPSTFFRKSVFDEFTPVEESLHFMMDHYIIFQYISKYGFDKLRYTDESLANIEVHDNAKSVKHIQKFRFDRQRIFYSFFESLNLNLRIGSHLKNEKKLQLQVNHKSIKDQAKEIKFSFIYSTLFLRDELGKRQKINFSTLLFLIINYPIKTAIEMSRSVNRLSENNLR